MAYFNNEHTTDCLSFFEDDELRETASINRKIIATNDNLTIHNIPFSDT